MTNYSTDRNFTNYVHNNIAIPKIYSPLNWEQLDIENIEQLDLKNGIDYVFNAGNQKKTVQERFREIKYQKYTDFTIRYRRDFNLHPERHESEYYKMEADYFTYGITNCYKNNHQNCTDFIKYAIIDMKKVYSKIDEGLIIIRNNQQNFCQIKDEIIECPIKYNRDGSSSFFPIDISYLVKLWGNEMIIAQKGFL